MHYFSYVCVQNNLESQANSSKRLELRTIIVQASVIITGPIDLRQGNSTNKSTQQEQPTLVGWKGHNGGETITFVLQR
jgi:hypothetical protein